MGDRSSALSRRLIADHMMRDGIKECDLLSTDYIWQMIDFFFFICNFLIMYIFNVSFLLSF